MKTHYFVSKRQLGDHLMPEISHQLVQWRLSRWSHITSRKREDMASLEPGRCSANFLSPSYIEPERPIANPYFRWVIPTCSRILKTIFCWFCKYFCSLVCTKTLIFKSYKQTIHTFQEGTAIIGPALHGKNIVSEDPDQMERVRSIRNRSKTRMALMRHHLSNGDLMIAKDWGVL